MRPAGAGGACVCLWGNGPPGETRVPPTHAAPRSESHADALDDRWRACVRACVHVGPRRCGLEGGGAARWLMMPC